MAAEVPQTLEYRGGQLNVAPMLEVENFTNWKKRFMCHIVGIEPLFKSIIQDGPYVPMTVATWEDLILYHEGPSDLKESRVMNLKLCYNTFKFKEGETLTQTFTRYKALMNELVNDGVKLSNLKINAGLINRLPMKRLSFCQILRHTNHVKDSKVASLFDKLKYEENLIDSIYETEKKKSLSNAKPLSTAFMSTFIVQDFQDSSDDEEDTRSNQEYMNDLEEEFHKRTLLAKSKSPTKDFEAKYNNVKANLALLSFGVSTSKSSMVKNKGLVMEAYEWDEEDVSSDDNEMVEVKELMALADEENVAVGKEGARNGEWVNLHEKGTHSS
ncbi:hypothetical protein Tco_1040114 [Tanacetum coccineum]